MAASPPTLPRSLRPAAADVPGHPACGAVSTGTTSPRPLALVTGASRGIGAATAVRLANDGYDLVLAARSAAGLATTAEQVRAGGGRAIAVPTDLVDAASVDALVEVVLAEVTDAQHPGWRILVNNAGLLPATSRSEKYSRADWDAVLDLNLTTPWYLACRAKEAMTSERAGEKGGVVVNIASTAGFYPSRGLTAYNVSKAALLMLTRALALEWARDGVRVVGVAPGKVDTELVEPILAWVERTGSPLNPLDRIGRPEEVADLVSFLCDRRAAYITGTIVTIDGGELLATGTDLAR